MQYFYFCTILFVFGDTFGLLQRRRLLYPGLQQTVPVSSGVGGQYPILFEGDAQVQVTERTLFDEDLVRNPDYHPYKDKKHDEFDWELFKIIALNSTNNNVLISPFSVKLLLTVLAEAAQSTTKDQLTSILPNLQPGRPVYDFYEKVLISIAKRNEKYEVDMGTKIYFQGIERVSPTRSFLEVAYNKFNTPSEAVNFQDDLTAAKINLWAEQITKGNIKNIINQQDSRNYVAVLINALYFKGSWENLFDERFTRKGTFYVNPAKKVQVPMMINAGNFYYLQSRDLNAKFLRLPYKGGKYSMTLILPNDPNGIDGLISKIRPGQIQQLQNQFKKEEVPIVIPKFKFESNLHLKEAAQKLGITEIFNNNANLPGLGKLAYVSDIIQKTGVNVDEKGTEIYAATTLPIMDKIGTGIDFRADHPFLFFLEDEETGTLLFAGKVIDPSI